MLQIVEIFVIPSNNLYYKIDMYLIHSKCNIIVTRDI